VLQAYGPVVPHALILGGTGAIGRATAHRLLALGWQVHLTGRDRSHLPADLAAAGVGFTSVDRTDPDEPRLLRTALGDGADLLVDATCFTAADAVRLLPLARQATSTVMISSKAVYVDEAGRHANSDAAPRFAGPIVESQPTLAPAGGDHDTRAGYGPNKVAAEQVLLDCGLPVTVLRASKVHGAGARRPREWVFVKRVLDHRSVLLLARGGAGVDHPGAAVNVAALIATVAAKPGRRVLNAADPDSPSALEISRTIAALLGHTWQEVLLGGGHGASGPGAGEGPSSGQALGAHPWDAPHPVILDTTAATDLGYTPVGDYAATVAAEVAWLDTAAHGGQDSDLLPEADDPFFALFLDYGAEDRYLSALPG